MTDAVLTNEMSAVLKFGCNSDDAVCVDRRTHNVVFRDSGERREEEYGAFDVSEKGEASWETLGLGNMRAEREKEHTP